MNAFSSQMKTFPTIRLTMAHYNNFQFRNFMPFWHVGRNFSKRLEKTVQKDISGRNLKQ
ncbi:hypothetical protein CFter6_4243 [Collimonas fungivorans]|uniref:Uncharacterized protein n=1 Tax=Collimonas fungivorans TaxID=158899 RepID=A0A127PGU6_9BURK|nr:hypothetical protein CFter6_4243 [Collimonas fungivorans]